MPSKNLDRIISQEEIIKSFTETHGNVYDYSKVVYQKGNIPVEIICSKHGIFLQTPRNHKCGSGCRKCGYEKVSKKLSSTKEYFVERANKKHGNIYDYSLTNYISDIKKLEVICKKHGIFNVQARAHLNGVGCKKCGCKKIANSKIYSRDKFIELVNKKHNCKYNYNNIDYTDSSTELTINCPIHGDFTQKAKYHLQGNGCSSCAIENKGYSRTDYIKAAKGRIATLYLIKCFNEQEEFYKIGITVTTVEERYKRKSDMPYNYIKVDEISGEAGEIYNLEKMALREFRNYKYTPDILFKGKTECVKAQDINFNFLRK